MSQNDAELQATQSQLSPELRRQLRQEASRRTVEAARHLLENDNTQTAKEHLQWAEQAGKVLQATARPPSRLRLAFFVAVACIVLAGLALGMSVPNNALQLEVTADAVSLRLARDWQSKYIQINGKGFSADNLVSVQVGNNNRKSAYRLDLYDAEFDLKELRIPAKAHMDIDVDGGDLALALKYGYLEGHLSAVKSLLVVDTEDGEEQKNITDETGEHIEFKSAEVDENPVTLRVSRASEWRLSGAHIAALSFARPNPPGSGNWVSTLREGKIIFRAGGRKVELYEGDELILDGLESIRLNLSAVEGGGIKLSLEGKADTVRAGPKDFEENYTPTLLEYLYHQQQLALFWGAVMFLWGMFWSLKNLW